MDKRIAHSKKKEKVSAILAKLGLTRVKDSLCGYPGGLVRGVSGLQNVAFMSHSHEHKTMLSALNDVYIFKNAL